MAKRTTKKKSTRKKTATAERTGRRYRILALDGGGVRGIITASWLARLEALLPGPVGDHFDLVAGTSTGSILACAIALRVPVAEVIDLYRTDGQVVFPRPATRRWGRFLRTFTEGLSAPKYDDEGLRSVLRRRFGETCFGDLARREPLLLVTAYNTATRTAVVLKTSRARHDDLPLWEAAKASSSAPTYFPAHVTAAYGAGVPLIDGGVVANNPTACAIAEGVRENRRTDSDRVPLKDFVVASFGTGHVTRAISAREAREWGTLEWAIPVIDVLMDGSADATDYIARQLLSETRYFRLQTPLDHAFDDLDDASDTNLQALLDVAARALDAGGDAMLRRLAALVR